MMPSVDEARVGDGARSSRVAEPIGGIGAPTMDAGQVLSSPASLLVMGLGIRVDPVSSLPRTPPRMSLGAPSHPILKMCQGPWGKLPRG